MHLVNLTDRLSGPPSLTFEFSFLLTKIRASLGLLKFWQLLSWSSFFYIKRLAVPYQSSRMDIMKYFFIGKTFACVLLCGCASSSALTSADGPGQTVLHVDGSPIPLKAVTFERRQNELERKNLMQRIIDLSNEVSHLKGRLVNNPVPTASASQMLSTTATMAAPAETDAVAPSQEKTTKGRAAKSTLTATTRVNRETIVIQENGVVFRVMHDFAKTDFHPSKSLQQQLLHASRAGQRIDIRGRTDARIDNEADRGIAMQRALNARLFLANNGIHPRKMHLNVMASGDNVADNATADGRARNRRVEIETAGIRPEVLEHLAGVIRQDLQ